MDASNFKSWTFRISEYNGVFVAAFSFAEGTSPTIQQNFMENGGRAIQAAIQVETGRESVAKAVASGESIHYKLSPKEHITKTDIEGGTSISYRYGETGVGRIYERDESGKPVGVKQYTMEVIIYEGTIDAAIADKPTGDIQEGLDKEQRIGATFVHETEHATDPDEVESIKAGNSDQNHENHEKIRDIERKAVKEYKED